MVRFQGGFCPTYGEDFYLKILAKKQECGRTQWLAGKMVDFQSVYNQSSRMALIAYKNTYKNVKRSSLNYRFTC
jgi:hypothetical protein